MPTDYQQNFINHCFELSKLDKDYANWAVKNFTQLDPHQLFNLKELVLTDLKRRKNESKENHQ